MIAFNEVYKNSLVGVDNCYWLDFFDEMLQINPSSVSENDSRVLNPRYSLDGTHLSPSYVSLLQEALLKYSF